MIASKKVFRLDVNGLYCLVRDHMMSGMVLLAEVDAGMDHGDSSFAHDDGMVAG